MKISALLADSTNSSRPDDKQVMNELYRWRKGEDATDPHSACREINGIECGKCRTEGAKISDPAPLSLL